MESLLNIGRSFFPTNIVNAAGTSQYLGVIMFSIVFAACLNGLGPRAEPLAAIIELANDVIMKMVCPDASETSVPAVVLCIQLRPVKGVWYVLGKHCCESVPIVPEGRKAKSGPAFWLTPPSGPFCHLPHPYFCKGS